MEVSLRRHIGLQHLGVSDLFRYTAKYSGTGDAPMRRSCPVQKVGGQNQKTKSDGAFTTYHIVYADPEGEETVRAVPLRTLGFRGENVVKLPYLVDYGSAAATIEFNNTMQRREMLRTAQSVRMEPRAQHR